MKRTHAEIDALTLERIDALGHVSILFDAESKMHSGSRHAPVDSLRRLCRRGVLRAESFSPDETMLTEQIWIMRSDRFKLPSWAKLRGEQWWPPHAIFGETRRSSDAYEGMG